MGLSWFGHRPHTLSPSPSLSLPLRGYESTAGMQMPALSCDNVSGKNSVTSLVALSIYYAEH